jgi:NitT/TauT family transport system ATP-binding protein
MSESAHISVRGVSKVFQSGGQDVHALQDINLEVGRGEFVCLLGPSGCGKSTLLNAVAGFSLPSAGTITVEGSLITEPGPIAAWSSRSTPCSPG